MLGLIDFIVGIVDFLAYWRLGLGLALTALACLLLLMAIPDHPVQWVVCAPLGLAGAFFSFRWQYRSDREE